MYREYQPCLPTRAMKAPSGELWVSEIKHDGLLFAIGWMQWQVLRAVAHISEQVGDIATVLKAPKRD
jgi:hypothetical protein